MAIYESKDVTARYAGLFYLVREEGLGHSAFALRARPRGVESSLRPLLSRHT